MKTALFIVLMLWSFMLAAQDAVFVRIYNKQKQKISSGFLKSVTDSSITVMRGFDTYTVSLSEIQRIATKRSAANNIILGAVSVGLTAAMVAVIITNPDDFIFNDYRESAVAGMALGAPAGAVIGAATLLIKHSEKFVINGDLFKLKEFGGWATHYQYIK
jgi:proteasome assembly chaperone (PAC2) family protein